MTFTTTRVKNPCKICSNTDGRCRETEWGYLCMVIDYDTRIEGFRFIGVVDTQGRWGKWATTSENQSEKYEQWYKSQQLKQKQELEKRAKSLPANHRNELYRTLFDQLGLNSEDRENLLWRGLTDEEIEQSCFKSVERKQTLDSFISPKLSGVASDGSTLTNNYSGYLCPIYDVEGYLVACQLRIRDGSVQGKYRWLSGQSSPHLQNGELPLTVYNKGSSTIGFTEGVGPKPFITSLRLNQTVIGAAGGQFSCSPITLLHTLETLKPSEIVFYPDAGSVLNYSTLKAYQTTFALISEFGYECKIGWWNQTRKFHDRDVDELSDYSTIEYISQKQFWGIALNCASNEYKGICKQLGVKNRVNVRGAIDLLLEGKKLRLQQEEFRYRDLIRRHLHKLGMDWKSDFITQWMKSIRVSDFNDLRLFDFKKLREVLEHYELTEYTNRNDVLNLDTEVV